VYSRTHITRFLSGPVVPSRLLQRVKLRLSDILPRRPASSAILAVVKMMGTCDFGLRHFRTRGTVLDVRSICGY